jgi:protein ImuB
MGVTAPAGVAAGPSGSALTAFAREWSPRVETLRRDVVVLDARGLTRLFATPEAWARQLAHAARARGWPLRVAVAGTRIAAILLAVGRSGLTIVAPGDEARAVAGLPLSLLVHLDGLVDDEAPRPAAVPAARPRRAAAPAQHYRMAPRPDAAGFQEPDAPGVLAPTARRTPDTTEPSSLVVSASEPGAQRAARTRAARAAAEALCETLERWGLHTCGDLAALPAGEVAARLGAPGRRAHARARGADPQPLVDLPEDPAFEASFDLEWPIEALEPLSFVLARLLEPLGARLAREERGAAVVQVDLALITRTTYTRRLQLPAPMNDPKVLRTLILLDLDAHPPPAGIDRVTVRLEPMPSPRVQFSLFRRPLPAADQTAALLARLDAVMGEGRCGSPRLLDTHRPGAFAMAAFSPRPAAECQSAPRDEGQPCAVLRRFRRPVPVAVEVRDGRPMRISSNDGRIDGGAVEECAGPWRTSGAWWRVAHRQAWAREEWDVALRGGAVYRLSCASARTSSPDGIPSGAWVVEGVWD